MHLLYLSCANEHTWPNIFDLQKWLFWRMKSSKKSTGPLFYSKKKIFTPYFFFRKKFWPLSLKYSNIYTRGGAGPPPVCAPKSPRSDFSATSLLVLGKIWLKVFTPFLSKLKFSPHFYRKNIIALLFTKKTDSPPLLYLFLPKKASYTVMKTYIFCIIR